MKSIKHKTASGILLTALTILAPVVQAAESGITLTTGFDYSTGKYGTTESTDILYIPVIGKYENGAWTFKLTVPYLKMTAPSGGTIVDGRPVSGGTGARVTESGMGDVVTSMGYLAADGRAGTLGVEFIGKVKFATADDTKGLGSGKNDYSVQTDLFRVVDSLTWFGTLGYKELGDPPGTSLRDVWFASLGFSYKFSATVSVGSSFDFRQASTATGKDQEDLAIFASIKVAKDTKLQPYASKGFSDASPDWGVGLMGSFSF